MTATTTVVGGEFRAKQFSSAFFVNSYPGYKRLRNEDPALEPEPVGRLVSRYGEVAAAIRGPRLSARSDDSGPLFSKGSPTT